MTRRALPLLVDALPLYATGQQIISAMATTAEGQKRAAMFFALRGFPRPTPLMDGLFYVPSVLQFVEQFETGNTPTNAKGVTRWADTSRRQACDGERARAASTSRSG